MDQIIVEHFRSGQPCRTFSLIFKPELLFIKKKNQIYFFQELVFGFNNYDEDDEIVSEGIILKRRKEGYWTVWWSRNDKKENGNYHRGNKEGLWTYYYDGNKKWKEGKHKKGKKEGLWIFWHFNGQERERISYENIFKFIDR